MKRILVNVGECYGEWTVWGEAIPLGSHMMAICRCSCGVFNRVQSTRLVSGITKRCLLCAISKHGQTRSRTYVSWSSMHGRCANTKSPQYGFYGGRGICVCQEWGAFEMFLADMGERPLGLTLDRIDVNGGYTKENCRWATPKEQATNRRNTIWAEYEGEKYSALELSRHLGLNYHTVIKRIKKGVAPDAPVKKYKT